MDTSKPGDEKNVAVYIDHPNIVSQKNSSYQYNNEKLMKEIKEEVGRVIKCNSYWAMGKEDSVTSREDSTISESVFFSSMNHIDLKPIPTIGRENPKNPTDTRMAVDIMEDLYENPHIDVVVIVTSDKDFIPVFRKIIEKGKEGVAIRTDDSWHLTQFCQNMGVRVKDLGSIMRKHRDQR